LYFEQKLNKINPIFLKDHYILYRFASEYRFKIWFKICTTIFWTLFLLISPKSCPLNANILNFNKGDFTMSPFTQEIETTIQKILSGPRGILAADESFGTIGKRFSKASIESTPENRRQYREMLFSTPGIQQYISGIILFDETIRQKTSGGKLIPEYLKEKNIVPGIKVDKGTTDLSNYPEEKITEGLDGLHNRCIEYKELGAQFTKWRAVFHIGRSIPTAFAIDANAFLLSRFASISQSTGLVPIVEPEVLIDGKHDIETCEIATTAVLKSVLHFLYLHKVYLEGIILKPNMVLSGKENPDKASPEEVSERTLRTLYRTVPAAVPAIAFLSGGQSPIEATQNLAAINSNQKHPWALTFSFSRALQDLPLQKWKGVQTNVEAAQRLFLHRAQCNSAARSSNYSDSLESQQE
jgi:fructose-bisphosphate aldolase class I